MDYRTDQTGGTEWTRHELTTDTKGVRQNADSTCMERD